MQKNNHRYEIDDKSSHSDALIPLKLACKWWPRGSSAGLPRLGHTQINQLDGHGLA